jgi:hypothetical protein
VASYPPRPYQVVLESKRGAYDASSATGRAMIGTETLSKALRVIQFSSNVAGTRPLSAIIIGPSGGGKSMLLMNSAFEKSKILQDFTSESLFRFVDKERPSHILVPDFNTVISHKPTVANLTIAFLLSLLGEGASEIPGIDGKSKFNLHELQKDGYRCAFLTATTWQMFRARRGKWRDLGFLRRLVPIYYSYRTSTVIAINKSIQKEIKHEYRNGHNFGKGTTKTGKPVHVKLPSSLAQSINTLASETLKQLSWSYKSRSGFSTNTQAVDYSFDLHLWMQTFVKSSALLRNSRSVDSVDLDFLADFSRFIRYDRPEEI